MAVSVPDNDNGVLDSITNILSSSEGTFLSRSWHCLSETAASIFNGGDTDDGAIEDPLVEVVESNPAAGSKFIKTTMLFGAVSNAIVCLATAIFLSLNWKQSKQCDRPLRWWLLAHAVLQLFQVIVRVDFIAKFNALGATTGSYASNMRQLTCTPIWQANKMLSLHTYGWLVLGVVWILNARDCANNAGVYNVTLVVIIQSIARVACAAVSISLMFPNRGEATEEPKVCGALPDQIASLPCFRFNSKVYTQEDPSCAVCLSEFTDGVLFRRLPCGHEFHRCCADTWLQRSKRCPLCMRSIDEVDKTEKKSTMTWPWRTKAD